MNKDVKRRDRIVQLVPELIGSASIYTKRQRHRCTHTQIRFSLFRTPQNGPFLGSLIFGIYLRRLHGRRCAAVLRRALRTFKLSPSCCHRSWRIASYTAAKVTKWESSPDILVLFYFGLIHWLFCSFVLLLFFPSASLMQASSVRFEHPPATGLVKRQTKYRKDRIKLCQSDSQELNHPSNSIPS
ncbi:hypothetical protein GGI43DRAFT_23606 [Trichoderma evansii]